MKVLALDTSTMMASIGLFDEDRLVGEVSLSQEATHSESLVPLIKTMLENLSLKIEDIDLYVVAIGPGSFTGLRIGAATIKAFAHLFDKPIVGVSTLEGLAYNLAFDGIVVPMIDARRDRVYTGIYKFENDQLKCLLEPDAMEIDHLLDYIDENFENVIVNGDGSSLFRERISQRLGSKVSFATRGSNYTRASSIGDLGLKKYKLGLGDDYYSLVPDYLRESQAQRELRERETKA